ncbi:unnamed protein product [Spirodela intermedia]|uniref:Uncharacterized protein n=1 Tax=Spirodela intermedia TaxID=51605 RepID=A0A7I8K1Z7_SPIIN|nr:unnamed protein product [Spirodela intermedia]
MQKNNHRPRNKSIYWSSPSRKRG